MLVDRGFPDSRMVTVTSDHRGGAEEVARLLTRRGHRAIGILQGLPGTLPNEERLSGIRQVLQSASIEFSPSFVRGDHFSESSGYEATRWLIGNHPEITALIALSNQNALGALRAAAELGRRIPDDLSLVTFDDHPFADFLAAPLSTASQDVAELGRAAAKLVVERIESGNRPRKTLHRVPITIIERASVTWARL
jgi:LacI family transcriptional regulator